MQKKYEENYRLLGLNIAYYRKLKGLTQLQLAEEVDISRTFISRLEATSCPTSVSLETLFSIADALDTTASKLLEFRN